MEKSMCTAITNRLFRPQNDSGGQVPIHWHSKIIATLPLMPSNIYIGKMPIRKEFRFAKPFCGNSNSETPRAVMPNTKFLQRCIP